MTQRKNDGAWGRWHMLQNALYVVPGFGVGALVIFGRLSLAIGAPIVVLFVGVGIALDAIRFNTYRCRKCGSRLAAPPKWWAARSGKRFTFYCPDCDIIWETNFYYPDASD